MLFDSILSYHSYIFCGLLCPICLLGILGPFSFLGLPWPFSNHAFPWAFTNSLGLPSPNYLYLILGANGFFISPLISLLVLLWACCGPFSLFYILLMSLLLLSFQAHSSPFASLGPTLLAREPFIPAIYARWLFLACYLWSASVAWLFFFYWTCQNEPQQCLSQISSFNIIKLLCNLPYGRIFISAPNQVLSYLEMTLSLSPQGFA